MPDSIGAHLLGRTPSPPDERDYALFHFLSEDPLDKALASALRSHLISKAQKSFDQQVRNAVRAISPSPVPPSPPSPPSPPQPSPTPTPSTLVTWRDEDDPVLDQGNTPHCVGFTGADWMNELPVDDHVPNSMGDDLYAACKVVDGEPGQQNGSTIRSLAKVLQTQSKLKVYAFAGSIEEVWTFVERHGPICWGIGWTDSMFTPDGDGFVTPSGRDVGGHAVTQCGVDGDVALMLNHWGTDWGLGGLFKMRKADLAERLANGGEAMAAVEVGS